MLLRRIMEHVKDQNWFAVGLDFLIVVLGVFIGIQVSNWNAARLEADLEAEYLKQLHLEVLEAEEVTRSGLASREFYSEQMRQVLAILGEPSEVATLTNQQCGAIFFSHIYDTQFASLPTLEELFASGRVSIIRDQELRRHLSSYRQELDGIFITLEGIKADRFVIARHHPDLYRIQPEILQFLSTPGFLEQAELNSPAVCDLAAMRNDPGFINNLTDNAGRTYAIQGFVEAHARLLSELHTKLDRVLNIEAHKQSEDTGGNE